MEIRKAPNDTAALSFVANSEAARYVFVVVAAADVMIAGRRYDTFVLAWLLRSNLPPCGLWSIRTRLGVGSPQKRAGRRAVSADGQSRWQQNAWLSSAQPQRQQWNHDRLRAEEMTSPALSIFGRENRLRLWQSSYGHPVVTGPAPLQHWSSSVKLTLPS